MNTRDKISYYCALVTIVTSCSLQAMFFKPLSEIEKNLVKREIKKRDPESIRNEINNAKKPKYGLKQEAALAINETFHKNNATTDPLTKNIFETIETIEKQSGYTPEFFVIPGENSFFTIDPTNWLGSSTRYYWENDNNKTAVRVVAHLTNKEELKTLVNNYNQ